MFRFAGRRFYSLSSLALLTILILGIAAVAGAQEVGGDLSGGAGIFRAKNPDAKRTSRPTARPARPTVRPNPAEVEERFEDALADGNEKRDGRKFLAAETSYRDAQKLKPKDWRAPYGLGNVFSDQQRWEDAEKSYRQAVDVAPNNAETLMALSFVLVQPRTGAINAKRFADAEYFARRATQIDPKSAVAFDRLGVALFARNIMNQDTEAAFRKAVELDPNLIVAQVHLARALRQLNRAAEADPIYQSAIQRAQDAPTLVLIADAMQSEQRFADSEPVLKRALDLDPRNPGALFLMGRLFAVTRKYAEAEVFLKRAIEVNPRSFPARNILGRSYLGLERYEEAYDTYEHAVDLASEADRRQLAGTFGFGGVGDGYMNAGHPREALRAYQKALQLDPTNAELPNKIAAARAKLTP